MCTAAVFFTVFWSTSALFQKRERECRRVINTDSPQNPIHGAERAALGIPLVGQHSFGRSEAAEHSAIAGT
jgi:hypothetical protein